MDESNKSVFKSLFDEALRWIIDNNEWNNGRGILSRALVLLIAFVVLIGFLRWLMSSITDLAKSISDIWTFTTADRKRRDDMVLKRRFASVLESDLDYIDQAENWNDLQFVDLEAEVEMDGEYYSTSFNRRFGLKSRGLRRVKSLMKAIETSVELKLVVVGEPGCGKSVALRHLAIKYAKTAKSRRLGQHPLPLYINLKELSAQADEVDADAIKSFVLDHVRRGRSDTGEYLTKNWEEFALKGQWLLLFDSFDEVPGVLHASTGSQDIKNYSLALYDFLSQYPECRSVIASREFKGPGTLPWQKIRICPLSDSKQRSLVNKAFLESEHRRILKEHLVTSSPALRSNPMFLSLLCRYVRYHNDVPANDRQLLLDHLEHLTIRDSEYVLKKYGLSPEDLMSGARTLAELFAVNSDLSLAPTIDEIQDNLSRAAIPGSDIEVLLLALVYVKIGRVDVANAKRGDRRFTFAHRRYQEVLFVASISTDLAAADRTLLLYDVRWREYTVTLLQTEAWENLTALIEHACGLASASLSAATRNAVMSDNLDLHANRLLYLLRLLDEGLSTAGKEARDFVTARLSLGLYRAWEVGGLVDRFNLLRIAFLLPDYLVAQAVIYAINSNLPILEELTLKNVQYLERIPQEYSTQILRMLSHAALKARDESDVTRVRALGKRLPESLAAVKVLQRNLLLRQISLPFGWLELISDSKPLRSVTRSLVGTERLDKLRERSPREDFTAPGLLFLCGILLAGYTKPHLDINQKAISVVIGLYVLILTPLFIMRYYSSPFDFTNELLKKITFKKLLQRLPTVSSLVLVSAGGGFVFCHALMGLRDVAGSSRTYMLLLVILLVYLSIQRGFQVVRDNRKERDSYTILQRIRSGDSGIAILQSCRGWGIRRLQLCLEACQKELLMDTHSIKFLVRTVNDEVAESAAERHAKRVVLDLALRRYLDFPEP